MAPLATSAPVTRRFFGQGVWNIVRFNWPFYALALAAGAAGLLLRPWLPAPWRALVGLGLRLAGLLVQASLVVSAYVYDYLLDLLYKRRVCF
jgi:hypothetical protein